MITVKFKLLNGQGSVLWTRLTGRSAYNTKRRFCRPILAEASTPIPKGGRLGEAVINVGVARFGR